MENKYIFQLRDTILDTKKFFVPVNTKFSLRSRPDKKGESIIYLSITHKNRRQRINLDLKVQPDKFNPDKGIIIGDSQQDEDLQLILENIDANIAGIKPIIV